MGVSRGDEEVEPLAWMRLSGRKHVKRGGPGTLTLTAVSMKPGRKDREGGGKPGNEGGKEPRKTTCKKVQEP